MREGWTETTLGDISDFISLRVAPAKIDSATPYVGLEHLVPRSSQISDWDTVEMVSSSVTPFEPGDTLFGRLRPYLHKVALADFPGTCSPELLVLRSNENSDAGYLYLLCSLDSTIGQCVAMSAGTRMPRTSASDLASIEVQLPPITEQRRIVDLMSSVDSYIAALQQQADAARSARSAVLGELLSGDCTEGFETSIGHVAQVLGGKRLPKQTPWADRPTRHPYIRATDIRDGRVDTDSVVYVPDEIWPTISRFIVESGDVLITIAGTIGSIAQVPESLVGANLTENAAMIRPHNDAIRPEFLKLWLMGSDAKMQIQSLTIGTTQKKLGLARIESIRIILPPLAEQRRIVGVISSIDLAIQSTERAVADAKNLRSGLLSDLLSGAYEIPESYDRLLGAA